MVKRILKFVGAIFAVAIIAGAGIAASQWNFLNRYLTVQTADTVLDLSWYRTFDLITGTPGDALVVADETTGTIPAAVLAEAETYVAERDSLAFLVWQGGALQHAWYADGFAVDTAADTRSMHKSVLALVVGLAIEDGFIASIDEPAATYLPEWADDPRAQISIRHMLEMTTGLGRYPFEFQPWAPGVQFNMGQNIAPYALGIEAARPPGEVFSYNNLNSQLLGIIVERATGERYADYLERRLWSKLEAGDARVVTDRDGGLARTYCCLQTTAEAWLRFGLLHLNKGRVNGEQIVPEAWMAQVASPSETNPNYGFQTWLGTTHEPRRSYGEGVAMAVKQDAPFAADDVIFLDGAGGQRVYVIPSADMVIVRIGYGGPDFAAGTFKWEDTGLPNLLLAGLSQPVPPQ